MLLSLSLGLGTLVKADNNIAAGFLQVQCMCVTLRSVTDDADLLSLKIREITILLVKHSWFCHFHFLLILLC